MVPMLYVTFQQLRERVKQRFGDPANKHHPPTNSA
jgi:hypothetical protein